MVSHVIQINSAIRNLTLLRNKCLTLMTVASWLNNLVSSYNFCSYHYACVLIPLAYIYIDHARKRRYNMEEVDSAAADDSTMKKPRMV